MSDPNRRGSVARAITLKIAASPFNGVKLDLGLACLACLATFLLLAGLGTPRSLDSLILAAVAGSGAAWVVWRTHRVLHQQQAAAARAAEDDDGAQ